MCGRPDRAGVVAGVLAAAAIAACNFRPQEGDGGAPQPRDGGRDALVIDSPPGAPSVPQDLVAVAGDAQIVLTWQAPANAASVTGPVTYSVLATANDSTVASSSCTGTQLGCTLGTPAPLVDGATYNIQLTAMNAAGTSAAVTATATPFPAILGSDSTILWLDANRPGPTTGSAVTAWVDRSVKPDSTTPPNSATQSTSVAQPTLGAVAGLAAVLFDGTNDYLKTGNLFDGNNTYSLFVAYVDRKASVPANAVEGLYSTRMCGTNPTGLAGFAFNSSGQGSNIARIPGVESTDATSDSASTDDGSAKPQPKAGGQGPKEQIEANTWSTLEQTITLPNSEQQTPLYLGGYTNNCNYGEVGLGEMIVIQSASQSQVDAVQSYLLHHWHVTQATD